MILVATQTNQYGPCKNCRRTKEFCPHNKISGLFQKSVMGCQDCAKRKVKCPHQSRRCENCGTPVHQCLHAPQPDPNTIPGKPVEGEFILICLARASLGVKLPSLSVLQGVMELFKRAVWTGPRFDAEYCVGWANQHACKFLFVTVVLIFIV